MPMPLSLPGEDRTRPRLLEVLLAIAVVVGLCGLGCATPSPRTPRTRRLAAPVMAPAHTGTAPSARPPSLVKEEGAEFVARSLRDGGLRFGTDGSTRALWGYLRLTHDRWRRRGRPPGRRVVLRHARHGRRPGLRRRHRSRRHRREVEPDGRIVFVEARGGQVRRSVVDPTRPTLRRNAARRDRQQLPAREGWSPIPPTPATSPARCCAASRASIADAATTPSTCQPSGWRAANEISDPEATTPGCARAGAWSGGCSCTRPDRRFPNDPRRRSRWFVRGRRWLIRAAAAGSPGRRRARAWRVRGAHAWSRPSSSPSRPGSDAVP